MKKRPALFEDMFKTNADVRKSLKRFKPKPTKPTKRPRGK